MGTTRLSRGRAAYLFFEYVIYKMHLNLIFGFMNILVNAPSDYFIF